MVIRWHFNTYGKIDFFFFDLMNPDSVGTGCRKLLRNEMFMGLSCQMLTKSSFLNRGYAEKVFQHYHLWPRQSDGKIDSASHM